MRLIRHASTRLLLGLLLSAPLYAQTDPVLSARPGLCILQEAAADACVMAVELEWQSTSPAAYCLYHSLTPEPLQCWQNALTGILQSQLNSRVDVSYWLQLAPANNHLAEINIRVVSLAQRNPERRRRRHVWSVL
jgi:hypothetical protein